MFGNRTPFLKFKTLNHIIYMYVYICMYVRMMRTHIHKYIILMILIYLFMYVFIVNNNWSPTSCTFQYTGGIASPCPKVNFPTWKPQAVQQAAFDLQDFPFLV